MPDEGLAERVYKHTIARRGATFNLMGDGPIRGYMVGGFGSEVIVPLADFNVGDIVSYLAWNWIELDRPGRYLGTWIDDGNVYLDISQNYSSLQEALKIAGEKSQPAIWSVSSGREISL